MDRNDFGTHYLIDFIDCDPDVIKFVEPTREIMLRALKACGATIIDNQFHQFEPFGVSGSILIAESHSSFHSWPESSFAAVDIFTCGEMKPEIAVEIMKEGFGAREANVKAFTRGSLERA